MSAPKVVRRMYCLRRVRNLLDIMHESLECALAHHHFVAPSIEGSKRDDLNLRTACMRSSMLPREMRLMTLTGLPCPCRYTLPMRCSRTAGFHGRSRFTTIEALCKFKPTPPASVERKMRHAALS